MLATPELLLGEGSLGASLRTSPALTATAALLHFLSPTLVPVGVLELHVQSLDSPLALSSVEWTLTPRGSYSRTESLWWSH